MSPPSILTQPSLFANERWLPVVGFEGRYEVSDLGRMRPLFSRRTGKYKAGRIKQSACDNDGYPLTILYRADGTKRCAKIHTFVLEAFVGPRPNGMQCRHLNGNPTDNRLENLRWGTCRENQADKIRHGRSLRGERQNKAKLRADDVRAIRRLLAAGSDPQSVAGRFGVSRSTVYHIASGYNWAWLE